MSLNVRPATADDVAACVGLVEQARARLATYEPRFWRRADGTAAPTATWFAHLVAQADTTFLVAVEGDATVGFLIGRPQPPPPVYDPGGPTVLIDDFCVQAPERWSDVGAALLEAARRVLSARGVAQIVVVCPAQDREKTALLDRSDLSLASTWWTAAP
ncbi:MAG: GNAT family N-acetyltransferase [Phenylobacterium sp.]